MKPSVESASSFKAFVGVVLGSLVAAAIVTTGALVVADRFDRPMVELVPVGDATMVVQIDGAVATPGVYTLPTEARLVDAISAAGGLRDDAAVANLNMAARIGDGESISVGALQPTTEIEPPQVDAPANPTDPGPVNINTASIAELETLPGIGPVIGERIVAYRDANGPFASVEALTSVEGISDSMVDELRPLVTIND